MEDFIKQYGFLIIQMTFAAMLGLSMYLPLMAGQLSLASAGFYAIGGYIAAVMSTTVFAVPRGAPFPIEHLLMEMLVAGVVSAILAVIVGVPSLRLRGIYLALATIALVEIVRVVSLNLEITGGAIGIFGIPQPFNDKFSYGYIAFPMLLISAFFAYRLERSRIGRAFVSIREDELAAAAMGVNPTYYKVLSFVMGAVLAGVVGAVSAHFLNTWNSRQGTFDASVLYLAFVIIGGSRTFVGPIMGGLLLTALPEVLRALANTPDLFAAPVAKFLSDGRWIVYGVLIVIGTIFFPQGLITPSLFKWRPLKRWGLGRAKPALKEETA